jgi:uncharacterized protein YdgA (DUF945 family)
VGQVRLTSASHFESGIPVGRYQFTVDSVAVAPAAAAAKGFALDTLSMDSGATIKAADFANSDAHFEIASLRAGSQTYAPVLLDLDVQHLYVPAYIALTKAVQQAQRAAAPGTPPLLAAQQSLATVQPPLLKLLAQQPVLQLKQLRIGMPQGILQGSGNAELLAPAGAALSAPALLQALQARFTFSAPLALALHLAAARAAAAGAAPAQSEALGQRMLQQLVQQGLLRRQGSDYVLELAFSKGVLQVNGHVLGPH